MYGRTILFLCSTFFLTIANTSEARNPDFCKTKYINTDLLNITVPISNGVCVLVYAPNKGSVVIGFKVANAVSTARKMKMNMNNLMQYLLVPAFALAGIMPWVLPSITTIVGVVGMINQFIFGSSLFMLVRTYIFDTTPQEHVLYLNTGYDKKSDRM